MGFYPEKIDETFAKPSFAAKLSESNASGGGASFICGSAVRLNFLIDPNDKKIIAAAFQTSGCGFMIAAADALCGALQDKCLTDFHGAEDQSFYEMIFSTLTNFSSDRMHCAAAVLSAVHSAFADFRRFQIEEFSGDKALVCTCFGVSEETVELAVKQQNADSVERVGELCNAGTGCGSCQPLIAEIIDTAFDIFE